MQSSKPTIVSILHLLIRASTTPYDAILGDAPGTDGFADLSELPEARTVPGILVYRFDAALVFFNADYFKRRVRQMIGHSVPMPRILFSTWKRSTILMSQAWKVSRRLGLNSPARASISWWLESNEKCPIAWSAPASRNE